METEDDILKTMDNLINRDYKNIIDIILYPCGNEYYDSFDSFDYLQVHLLYHMGFHADCIFIRDINEDNDLAGQFRFMDYSFKMDGKVPVVYKKFIDISILLHFVKNY